MEEKLKEGYYFINLYDEELIGEWNSILWYVTGSSAGFEFEEAKVLSGRLTIQCEDCQKRYIQEIIKEDEDDGFYD